MLPPVIPMRIGRTEEEARTEVRGIRVEVAVVVPKRAIREPPIAGAARPAVNTKAVVAVEIRRPPFRRFGRGSLEGGGGGRGEGEGERAMVRRGVRVRDSRVE